ncbi:uncharacterized protein LOC132191907 [Corylus avellana]|uniref:uncharacterized protein LOC132191907 n=1 Tax=Corylus avellana TaxID=13451 RepID=UPI001E22AAE6|nr:uncharacterized protein LOC132191907 [Corylus avellana]XP_059463020.1 uncharacterized protein LOC132191907 [Corylus avellana]
MMAQKHLHELLKEDQEPFLLKNYIADRRGQLKRPSPKTHLQVKKRKPITETPNFPGNFCKNACFFSFQDSPDLRKSPLFEFSSPAKSPCRSPNAIFLNIPARTAALLLEAAMRIQKQSSASKSKTQNKNNHGFGVFGSILKRLSHRSRKREIEGDGVNVSVKDILRWDSSVGRRTSNESMKTKKKVAADDKSACETSYSGSCNGSAIWSESNEDKSLDMESSICSQSVDSEVIEFLSKRREDTDFACCDKHFCESPFRFVLQRTPSSGSRTPDFTSPAASPSRHKKEENETIGVGSFKKLEEEEEKEQCSPVSVLDPPFEDDDDRHVDEDEDEDGGFDHDCSYAIVQRAKQQLLQKLRRFEKLAELDPIELEKRMLETEQDDDSDNDADDLEEEDDLETSFREKNADEFVMQVLGKSRFHNLLRIPADMKSLVSDLIVEEGREQNAFDNSEEVVNKVCKRLESWKEVQSNTIDMMVEQDFRKEFDGRKRNQEQVGEMASEIELAIFGLLVQEFSEELVSLRRNY